MAGLGPALKLNFDAAPEPPDWLVEGLIERETVTVMSADSGVGKSIICNGLVVSLLHGDDWLGRAMSHPGARGEPGFRGRAVVIDEENVARVVRRRLQAFGMTNEDRANLLYFSRIGTSLGEGDWFDRTSETLQRFDPDLLVIDTAAAATSVDVNDNTAVANFYSKVLRPLAYHCAVILLHHERKPATGQAGKRHAGHAMMGARQWAGQSDAHLALEGRGEFEEEEQTDGTLLQRHPLKLEMPKSRDGASKSATTHFSVTSLKEVDGETLRWLRLEVEDIEPGDPRARQQAEWAEGVLRIIENLGGKARLSEIASALGAEPSSGALARGLRRLNEDGLIERPEHGVYQIPPPQTEMF